MHYSRVVDAGVSHENAYGHTKAPNIGPRRHSGKGAAMKVRDLGGNRSNGFMWSTTTFKVLFFDPFRSGSGPTPVKHK